MSITTTNCTISTTDDYTFYSFKSTSGTIQFSSTTTANVLIVGGGGGGGFGMSRYEGGGGGGAGSVGIGRLDFTSNITYISISGLFDNSEYGVVNTTVPNIFSSKLINSVYITDNSVLVLLIFLSEF